MRIKYTVAAVAVGLVVTGTAWAFSVNASRAGGNDTTGPVTGATETTTVETDNCCLTGDCCCPGQGDCCDPAAKAKAASSGIKYVKKAGPGCCVTGDCCCPGEGSCCAPVAAKAAGKSCCSAKAEKKSCCTE